MKTPSRSIQSFLKKNEAAVITSRENRFYLSSFLSSAGLVFVTHEKSYLLVDFRYIEAAKKQAENCEVLEYRNLKESLQTLCNENGIVKVFFESESMSVASSNSYRNMLKAIDVSCSFGSALDRLIFNARIIKTDAEIEKIEKAQQITEKSLLEIYNIVKPGVMEKDIALELEYQMKKNGAQAVSFDLITIAGKNTSKPHGVPSDYMLKKGDFALFDIGAVYDGYHSDMTRTVAVGSVSDKQKEIYDIVLKANLKALEVSAPGIKASKVDNAARSVIENAGYADFFGHSTGHGVGLDVHENPNVSPMSETLLCSGMVITIEPGIYLPDEFGVRIEDMIVITKDGYKNLTTLSKELLVL